MMVMIMDPLYREQAFKQKLLNYFQHRASNSTTIDLSWYFVHLILNWAKIMEPILAQKLDKNSNVHTQLELYIVSFTKIRKLNNDWNWLYCKYLREYNVSIVVKFYVMHTYTISMHCNKIIPKNLGKGLHYFLWFLDQWALCVSGAWPRGQR